MSKTLTDNEIISTSEINRQLKARGVKEVYGHQTLTSKILLKNGHIPLIKLREAIYWSRETLNKLIEVHTIKKDSIAPCSVASTMDEDFKDSVIGELTMIRERQKIMYHMDEKLNLLMKKFGIGD